MNKKMLGILVCLMLVTSFSVVFPNVNVKAAGTTIYVDDGGNIYIMNTHKDTVVKFIKM